MPGDIIIIHNNINLRLLQMSDAKELFLTTRKDDAHLRQWLGWLDDDKSVEDVENYIIGSLERFKKKEGIDWLIWDGENLIGGVALYPLDSENKKTSVMYWIIEDYQGKGIMTVTLKKIINFIFEELKLHRIEIRCAIGNIKSSNIPKKLGFTYEGISRQSEWLYDHFVDLETYSLLATDNYISLNS